MTEIYPWQRILMNRTLYRDAPSIFNTAGTPEPISESTAREIRAAAKRRTEQMLAAMMSAQLIGYSPEEPEGLHTASEAISAEKFREAFEESMKNNYGWGAHREPHEGIIDFTRTHYEKVRGLWMGNIKDLANHDAPEFPPHAALFMGVPLVESEMAEPGTTLLEYRADRLVRAYISPHPPDFVRPFVKRKLLRNIKRDTRGPGHPRRSKKRRNR